MHPPTRRRTLGAAASRLLIVLLGMAALLAFAVPAAADSKERIGERINVLLGTPTSYPANTPFHVAHGWILFDPGATPPEAVGKWFSTLDLDNQPVDVSFVERFVADDGTLSRFWVFNFPTGLPAGTHLFTARWWGPCEGLINAGFDPGGPCMQQNELRAANGAATLLVEFTQ